MPQIHWIIFSQNLLCIYPQNDVYTLPSCIQHLSLTEYVNDAVTLHEDPQQIVKMLDLQQDTLTDPNHQLVSLRDVMMTGINLDFQHIARAWQYAQFLRTHQYCGQCGSSTRQVQWEMARHCDVCHHRTYPRVSPCIIVAIHNGQQILLAQGNRHITPPMFSTLAGFVESGESLEQAVHREVEEEVGVKLKNIQYFGSQAWPFPHQLMVGFTAEYAGGEIAVDGKEILAADWFSPDDLPNIPSSVSISRDLIDYTCAKLRQNS
jgi:NAD+ diphosphatase